MMMMIQCIVTIFCILIGCVVGELLTSDYRMNIPTVTLRNGVKMPLVGLGTWEYDNKVALHASYLALKLGYIAIDTAQIYENQKGVGIAIKMFEAQGGRREDLFITTKIVGGLNEEQAYQALENDLKDLQLDYVDLMLVHFPADFNGTGGRDIRIQGWRAMERFYKEGKARAIGVSHFCKQHVQDLIDEGMIVPMVNQVEYHIGMGPSGPLANDDRDFDREHGILYQSFSPLCGPCKTKELITGKMVTDIGKKYNKSGAQISLKWLVQQGIPVIPKTSEEKHLIQNADLFDFELSDEDMKTLTEASSPAVSGGGDDGTSGDCKVE